MSSPEVKNTDSQESKKAPDYTRDLWAVQRADLSNEIAENTNIKPRAILPNESIQDYLKDGLSNDMLILRAMSSLQLQGYREVILPEGYQIEVESGEISLFKVLDDGSREYYKAAETGKLIQALPLLTVIPHQEVLYFKSGGYKEALPFKKSKNKHEARLMVKNALDEGCFAKLTGMVNGVKISDKVRLGTRHKVAAQEMLYLLENRPSIFDAETLSWVNQSGNLDDLKSLAKGEWKIMNQSETDAFKKARSAEGVIQLTLAWRRLRSVLPATFVEEIRENALDEKSIVNLQMGLRQTEAISGNELAEDRKVVVESMAPITLDAKAKKDTKPSEVIAQENQVKEEPDVVTTKDDEQKKEDQNPQASEPAPETVEGQKESDKSSKEIAQEAWKKDQLMFKDLLEPYPEITMSVSDTDNNTKIIELSFASDLQQKGELIVIKQVTEVTLPTTIDGYPTYKKEDKELLNPGAVIDEMTEAIKAQIKAPALEQFETLIQDYILRALPAENIPQGFDRLKENRQERQAMRSEGKGIGEIREKFKEKRQTLNQRQEEFIEGNFDSVINEIRQHYSAKSLKLDTLVGKQRYTDTTFFSGGGLGLSPLLISVERPNDEAGLVFSGAKIKKPIFYSLESNTKYEVETSN